MSLKTHAFVDQLLHTHDLVANYVVDTRVVVGDVFLAGDQLLSVDQLTAGARAHFVAYRGPQINEHIAVHVHASVGLAEEGAITAT